MVSVEVKKKFDKNISRKVYNFSFYFSFTCTFHEYVAFFLTNFVADKLQACQKL